MAVVQNDTRQEITFTALDHCIEFRKANGTGEYLWPGFGDNIRVLSWIVDRLEGRTEGIKTPVGIVASAEDINSDGSLETDLVARALAVHKSQWTKECASIAEHFTSFGDHLPTELSVQLEDLNSRVGDMEDDGF